MKKKIGLLMTCLLSITIFFACEKATEEEGVNRFNTGIEVVKEVEILYSDSAKVKVRITGETMLNHLDRTEPLQEFKDGVLVEFFGANEQINSRLVADYAIRYEKEGKIICRDSVVWSSIDGQKLETEELIWEEDKEEVFTRKFARITTPQEIIYGHGFRAKQDFSNAKIQQVEGIITVDDLD